MIYHVHPDGLIKTEEEKKMEKTKHTPGPWHTNRYDEIWGNGMVLSPAFTSEDAALIVAAVNLAFQVNPDDPIAAINTLLELWKKENSNAI